jgi:uroporphyrinogen decarboxylase
MNHRERVQTALDHKKTDRPPFQATFVPEFAERLKKEFKLNVPEPYDFHSFRWSTYELEKATGQDILQAGIGWFAGYNEFTKPWVDEWGVQWAVDTYKTPFGNGIYTTVKKGPLADESKLSSYIPPDPNRPELYTNLKRLIKEYKKDYYIMGRVHCTIYETSWALRGYEQLLMDLYINPDLANAILDIPYKYHLAVAKKMAQEGVDMIWIGDDMGQQQGLLMELDTWRTFFKPRMANIISEVKKINKDIKVAYHTDGDNMDLIPDLIEIGLDVLNPIQAECMDPAKVKKLYGDKLSFFGAIAVQSTLPFGTPQDVKNEYKLRLETIGKDGGWICAPTHHVQLDTPMENFFALMDAIGTDYKK